MNEWRPLLPLFGQCRELRPPWSALPPPWPTFFPCSSQGASAFLRFPRGGPPRTARPRPPGPPGSRPGPPSAPARSDTTSASTASNPQMNNSLSMWASDPRRLDRGREPISETRPGECAGVTVLCPHLPSTRTSSLLFREPPQVAGGGPRTCCPAPGRDRRTSLNSTRGRSPFGMQFFLASGKHPLENMSACSFAATPLGSGSEAAEI